MFYLIWYILIGTVVSGIFGGWAARHEMDDDWGDDEWKFYLITAILWPVAMFFAICGYISSCVKNYKG